MPYTPFKFFAKNRQGKDFVVGDIHGSFTALEQLLQQAGFQAATDRVFAVGDLIDRGAESQRVTEFLNYPWFHSIMGNHEKILLDSADDPNLYKSWTSYNGGAWWKHTPVEQQQEIRQAIAELAIAFEVATGNGRVGIVHADIPNTMSWQQFVQNIHHNSECKEYALWSRNRFRRIRTLGTANSLQGIDHVVFGHSPTPQVIRMAHIHYIDTGAALIEETGLGKLTLLQIHPLLTIHQLDTRTVSNFS
jgi:serine/threonine protein phosphatase 1